MGLEAWILVLVLVAIVALLSLTRIAADAVLVAALGVLLALPVPVDGGWKMGIISIGDALQGFANPGLATVAVLFIVVAGLRETGAVDLIAERVLGQTKGLRRTILRLIVPVWAMSVFLNNTPVVAMMIPAAADWAKKLQCSPSKLMIPLSYAAILGGTCSLIGTSTNLVVAGLVIAETDLRLGMFDIARVGLPSAIVGATFLILFGPRLLPNRASPSSVLADPREYSLELIVPEGSSMAERTVEAAGLRNLPGCYLVEIERGGDIIPAGPQQALRAGDRLLFVGVVESIRDLQNLRGLSLATDQVFKLDSPRYRRRLFEAVISPSSPLIGRTIREGRFRNRYNGVVIAVARHGERVRGKLGDIEVQMGDVLLVEATPDFGDVQRSTGDFLLVRALEHSTPRRRAQAPIALAALVGMVLLATFNIYNMMVAAMLASGLMILTRCCTIKEARRSIDWSVLIVIGAALGLGRAMEVTGAAETLAGGVLSLAGTNPWLVLLGVYAVTSLLTEIITNNAAVALVFGIAQATAEQLGVSFMPFVIAIMMAGSASFATPLGYQTNTMVYGPGGYTFGDFLRIGVPMNVLMGLMAVLLTPLAFPF
jgi:di/tricarboxylate transporter